MTTGTNTAETRSASRCTAALPAWASLDQPADLGELGVGADPRRAHDEAPADVDRRADRRRRRRSTSTGTRLAGQHRRVDRGGALDDDAVGRDLLARAAPRTGRRRRARRRGCGARRRRAARRRPWRRARAAPAAPPPTGASRGPRRSARRGRRSSRRRRPRGRSRRAPRGRVERSELIRMPVIPASPRNSAHSDQTNAASMPTRDQRVHRRGAVAQVGPARPGGTASAPHSTTGAARASDQPLPVVELQRRDHRERDHRHGEHGRDEQPVPQRRACGSVVVASVVRVAGRPRQRGAGTRSPRPSATRSSGVDVGRRHVTVAFSVA